MILNNVLNYLILENIFFVYFFLHITFAVFIQIDIKPTFNNKNDKLIIFLLYNIYHIIIFYVYIN